jgi:tetratricopeptide (TPR) repeat protein
VAAVIAHFVEINFGIAIASTRAYFWVSTALILLAGYILPFYGNYSVVREFESENSVPLTENADKAETRGQNRKKRAAGRSGTRSVTRSNAQSAPWQLSPWLRQSILIGLLVGVVLMTLGYLYTSNLSRSDYAIGLIWNSLTSLANRANASPLLLALVLATCFIGCLVLVAEAILILTVGYNLSMTSSDWVKMILVALGVSLLTAAIFWLWHAGGLAALNRSAANTLDQVMAQVRSSEHILTRYYVYLLFLIFVLGIFIPSNWPGSAFRWKAFSPATAVAVFLVAFGVAAYTNLRVIQADISFKTAELFARPGSWPAAIEIYDRARDLAPSEDYYYLFLGRAYLEQAKSLQNPVERESLIAQAAQDLLEAQRINPLNTDHTANLARLHSLWTTYTEDPTLQQKRAELADKYFAQATSLSPNNARLWDEWAVHKINVMNDPQGGYELLQRALEIDPYYDWTYALIADYLARFASNEPDLTPEKRQEILQQSIAYYSQALDRTDPANTQSRYSYMIAYGGLLVQLGMVDEGIKQYEQALQLWPDHPDGWRLTGALAQLYSQLGQADKALEYARQALAASPDDQRAQFELLIQQLGGTP